MPMPGWPHQEAGGPESSVDTATLIPEGRPPEPEQPEPEQPEPEPEPEPWLWLWPWRVDEVPARRRRRLQGAIEVVQKLVDHPVASALVWLAILAATVLVGMQTYVADRAKDDGLRRTLDACEVLVLVIFTVEAVMRWFAAGPLRYFTSSWNVLDFVVVAGCLVPVESSASDDGANDVLMVLRLLRLLSVLKLVKSVPKVRTLTPA
jgi:hypothetical protein